MCFCRKRLLNRWHIFYLVLLDEIWRAVPDLILFAITSTEDTRSEVE
jgi:hypothetical protein